MATKTLNIAFDENLLEEIDKNVKKDMGTRSEYFRRLALQDIERRNEWSQVLDTANAKGRTKGITSQEKVDAILDEYKSEKHPKQA